MICEHMHKTLTESTTPSKLTWCGKTWTLLHRVNNQKSKGNVKKSKLYSK